jgi:hypothetical protein
MARKASGILYGLARNIGKAASTVNNIETFLTFDPKKIVNRVARTQVYKGTNKVARNINKLFK